MRLERTLSILLAAAGLGLVPAVNAAPQTAVRVEISAADYPHAKCNDGTQAAYYLRGAGTDGAISGRKWLIFLHGGGSCKSDEGCAERWYDPDAGPDGIIGYHGNMTAATAPTSNFNTEGHLDADGVDGVAVPGANPFAGFNRIMVPYCSSDTWSGRNTSARAVDYAAYVGTTVNVDGQSVTIRNPAGFSPLTSIRFSGRFIAEAVTDLVMNGGIRSGRRTGNDAGIAVEPPSAASDEVVISGSSAGGGGVVRNLDHLAGIVRAAAASVQVYGVIDAADGVGVARDSELTGDSDYERAAFYGATSTAEADASCQAVYPLSTSHKCFNSAVVLKSFIETPHYVVQNAYDGVIHGGPVQSIVLALTQVQALPATLAEALAVQYVRNQISLGARELGGGVANPQHVGYFIPNYETPKHQLLVEDVWFFNSPLAYTTYGGNDPRLGGDPNSTMGLPQGLACFRFKVTGQGSCVNANDAKVINTTYPTNPLSASYDPATSTLMLPFVRLANDTYYKNVSVVLSPLGTVTENDPSVGAFPSVSEYSPTTNVLKLPSVTVGSRVYQRVSVSGAGLRVLGYARP